MRANALSGFRIASVELDGIRRFRSLKLDFRVADEAPHGRVLLIGENGTCKSTLLRSIVLGLADPRDAFSLLDLPTGGFVNSGAESGRIRLELWNSESSQTPETLVREVRHSHGKEFLAETSEGGYRPLFVCAYGAGRFHTAPDSQTGGYRFVDAVGGLFNGARPLADPELTLRRLNDHLGSDRYLGLMAGFKRVLDLGEEDAIRLRKGGGIEILGPTVGGKIPLNAWADGYRVTFSWLTDFYSWALQAGTVDESGSVHGILIVDEIEQHLHPVLQASILPRLAELLPQVQILATTHSPLVALGANADRVISLKRGSEGLIGQVAVPDFSRFTVEDMLRDERLFEAPVQAPELQALTQEYEQLAQLARKERSPEQSQRLAELARYLGPEMAAPELVDMRDEVHRVLTKAGLLR